MAKKKFFILNDREDVHKGYTEVTQEDVRKYIRSFPEGDRAYFINLGYAIMETNKTEYRRFYREKRRRKYVAEEAERVGEFSYDAPNNTELEVGSGKILDSEAEPFEDKVIYKVLSEKIPELLSILTEDERTFIKQIYFENKSENELAVIYGINQSNICRRKSKILKKLKKFFNFCA